MLRNMGFSLAAVAEIMKSHDDPGALSHFLAVKRAEVQTEAEEAGHRLQLLETAIKRLREDGTMMKYDVTVKTMPERTVASVRKVIPSYDQEGVLM